MPRVYKLTWQAGSNSRSGRWRKKYKGKMYYFDGGRGKTDVVAYEAALAVWKDQQQRIDASMPRPYQTEHETAIETWEKVLAWSNRHGDKNTADEANRKLAELRRRLTSPTLKPLDWFDRFEARFDPLRGFPPFKFNVSAEQFDVAELKGKIVLPNPTAAETAEMAKWFDGSPERIQEEVWKDRLATQQHRAAVADNTLRTYVELYTNDHKQRVEQGEGTSGRLYAIRLHLGHFQDWLGGDTEVSEIDGKSLLRYRAHLLTNKPSRTTAGNYLATVRCFIRWLWQTEVLATLPRLLDGKSKPLKISIGIVEPVVFTVNEVTVLLESASDRLRLYILLMLNCGMTQKDIADLRIDEVDWVNGRIIRKRSKTKDQERVPTVNYLLWAETLRLLRQERAAASNSLVLLNANGSPIWSEGMNSEGKYQKTDNVKNAFDRLRKNLPVSKPLKSFKKTSSSLLASNARFRGLESLFLGHAPQSTSDKHYTLIPQDLFDESIRWLRQELKIEKPCARKDKKTSKV